MYQYLCLNILFLHPYGSELMSLFVNLNHKVSKSVKHICVSIHRFLFLKDAILLEDLSLYWMQLIIIIIIVIINLPHISRRTLIKNTLLCFKNCTMLKPSGKQEALRLHATTGQKENPRTKTKLGKYRCKFSPSYSSLLQK